MHNSNKQDIQKFIYNFYGVIMSNPMIMDRYRTLYADSYGDLNERWLVDMFHFINRHYRTNLYYQAVMDPEGFDVSWYESGEKKAISKKYGEEFACAYPILRSVLPSVGERLIFEASRKPNPPKNLFLHEKMDRTFIKRIGEFAKKHAEQNKDIELCFYFHCGGGHLYQHIDHNDNYRRHLFHWFGEGRDVKNRLLKMNVERIYGQEDTLLLDLLRKAIPPIEIDEHTVSPWVACAETKSEEKQ